MNLPHRCLTAASLLLLVTTGTLAQDDTDLIDDLPKERKEATREKPQLKKRVQKAPASKPQSPNVDLIDDLSPEQKEAAERNAARKNENAIPDNLADALARALRNSPAILVADAKVRQAEAELNEVRLSVVQELTLAFQRRASNKSLYDKYNVQEAKEKKQQEILADEARILYLLGVGAEDSAEAPRLSGRRSKAGGVGMMGAGAGTMQGMGMMPAMNAGMMGGMPMGGGMPGGMMMPGGMTGGRAASPAAQAAGAIPENVRTFLESRADIDFAKQPLVDVLTYLEQTVAGDVRFVGKEKLDPSTNPSVEPVTLDLKQVTVELGLQALSDLTNYCFIIRDYGILVEQRSSAESYMQAGIPMIGPGLRGIQNRESKSEDPGRQ